MESKKKATPKKSNTIQRRYKDSSKLHHDLFKLKVADMQKNIAWDGTEDLRSVEHCHFFHTVDSDGKVLTNSSAIGGHFHKMEVVVNDDGVPMVKCISGPVRFAKKKNRRTGKWEKVIAPTNDFDYHTHEIEYLKSEEITVRKTNIEAVQMQTTMAQKGAGVPGVMG